MMKRAAPIVVALALALTSSPAGAHEGEAHGEEFGSRRPGLVASGAAIAVAGAAGLVVSALVLRGTRSKTKDAVGTGVAVLGGMLLPLGLSLVASGTQQVPTGTTTPRDTTMMVTGGVVSAVGGIALGGGTALVARSRGTSVPGFVLLGGGNVLIGVGLPLWVRGSQRVEATSIGTQVQSIRASRPLTPF